MSTPHWPLLDLRLRTPRIELRPPDEATMFALVELADQGIHEPGFVPFVEAWTLEPDGERQRHSMQHYWRCWSSWTPDAWQLPFSVWVDGTLVGVQEMIGHSFTVTRTFETGSWLGLAHQGQGLGKEMRAAVLHFGFAGLGALRADTGAIEGNDQSVGVTRALGYVDNGQTVKVRQDQRIICNEFRMERAVWESRRRDDITIDGLDACLPMFGLE
ncbi:MAG: GNAT family N-acetyltransferase [Acidimicrobiales bacterium]